MIRPINQLLGMAPRGDTVPFESVAKRPRKSDADSEVATPSKGDANTKQDPATPAPQPKVQLAVLPSPVHSSTGRRKPKVTPTEVQSAAGAVKKATAEVET